MKTVKTLLLLAPLTTFSIVASAAGPSNVSGKVNTIWVNSQQQLTFLVQPCNVVQGAPSCSSQCVYAVALDRDSGRAIKEAVLLAKSHSFNITIAGTGNCTITGTSEDVGTIAVANP